MSPTRGDGQLRYVSREPARRYIRLKDYANDGEIGSAVINALIKEHCYWIREADVDEFRVDAVKHMGKLACSRFCSNIREYAYTLGQALLFLFGEIASRSDDSYKRYIGQNTSRQDVGTRCFSGWIRSWISG